MTEKSLKEFDEFLAEVSRKISFYLINPTNINEEKEKFLNNPTVNPIFTYNDLNPKTIKKKNELSAIFEHPSLIGSILDKKRIEYIKKIDMLQTIGTEEFTKHSINVYGIPNNFLIEQAKKLLDVKPEKSKPKMNLDDVKPLFNKAFMAYGFEWQIKEKYMVASAAVTASKKTIFLKKDSRFSMDFVKRLIVHEIGTHALRAENGSLQDFLIFKRGFPGYMGTEEGLAVVNEELAGVLNPFTLKVYAARAIAVNMAMNSSFVEIYNFMRQYFSEKISWRIALRAKRGLADTSKPGGLTKDHLYLDGYFKVKKYIEDGNNIKNLYVGKIGIDDVEIIKKMDIKKPQFLPLNISEVI